MTEALDLWIVQLDSLLGHVQKFVDDNPMAYKGKELKAYTTALGLVSVLAKQMKQDIQQEKADVEV